MSASTVIGEAAADAIHVEGLVVRYGRRTGVDGVDLRLRRGETCGLIGPNGAGKSTTLKVLATLRSPDEGTVRVLGRDVRDHPQEVRWRIGYMPDVLDVPERVSVEEYLRFAAAIHAIDAQAVDASVETALELTDLGDHRDQLLGELSKGMRQRAYLGRVLLPQPELLLLDEPASGLDPRARVELRQLLRELKAMGHAILVSSHVLADLAETCDSLAIVEAGRTVAHGPIEELQARLGRHLRVRIETPGPAAALGAALSGRSGASEIEVESERVRFDYDGDRRALAELLNALAHEGHLFCAVEVDSGDLEELFLRLTKGMLA